MTARMITMIYNHEHDYDCRGHNDGVDDRGIMMIMLIMVDEYRDDHDREHAHDYDIFYLKKIKRKQFVARISCIVHKL